MQRHCSADHTRPCHSCITFFRVDLRCVLCSAVGCSNAAQLQHKQHHLSSLLWSPSEMPVCHPPEKVAELAIDPKIIAEDKSQGILKSLGDGHANGSPQVGVGITQCGGVLIPGIR